jgi:hypothetical protein
VLSAAPEGVQSSVVDNNTDRRQPPSKANELVSSELLHVAPELGQLSEVPSARMGDWLDGGGLLLFLKHRASELGALNIGA